MKSNRKEHNGKLYQKSSLDKDGASIYWMKPIIINLNCINLISLRNIQETRKVDFWIDFGKCSKDQYAKRNMGIKN